MFLRFGRTVAYRVDPSGIQKQERRECRKCRLVIVNYMFYIGIRLIKGKIQCAVEDMHLAIMERKGHSASKRLNIKELHSEMRICCLITHKYAANPRSI